MASASACMPQIRPQSSRSKTKAVLEGGAPDRAGVPLCSMREQQSIVGRGTMMAIAATFAVCAVVALSAPQPHAPLALPLASWSARSATQQQTLRKQVLQEAPVTDPSNTETPVAPAPFAVAPVAPVAFAESPVAPAQVAVAPETPVAPAPVAVAPVAPVAFAETPVAPAQVAVAPETPVAPAPVAVAPVAAVAPVVAAAPLPQPPVAPAPRATSPAIGAAAAKLQEAEAPAPTPFNADIDNGGARSYGMQKTEDGKKDWSTIGQVHGGKTMAQAGGMGSAGPATAEAGLDETLEDYAKVKTERRQAMDFCSGKFSDWGNIQKCIFLLLKNAHY